MTRVHAPYTLFGGATFRVLTSLYNGPAVQPHTRSRAVSRQTIEANFEINTDPSTITFEVGIEGRIDSSSGVWVTAGSVTQADTWFEAVSSTTWTTHLTGITCFPFLRFSVISAAASGRVECYLMT